MRFAIHYLTEYRYDEPVSDNLNVLRVTPASTPTQELEDFRVQVDPEARLHRHTDYFGTQVVEFGITRPHEHLTIDVRARVTTSEPPEPLGGGWAALGRPGLPLRGRRVPAARAGRPGAGTTRWPGCARRCGARRPPTTVRALCELIPDRFEYRAGRHLRRLDGRGPAGGRRGRLPGLRAPRADAAARPRDRGALRLGLLLRAGAGETSTPPRPRSRPTPGSRRCCPPRAAASRAGRAPTPPTASSSGPEHVKIGHGRRYDDIPPVKGVFRGGSGSKMESSVRMTRADATGVAA